MSVDITGRHIEVTEPLRKFATDRLERLRGMMDEILEAHLILTVEKHQRHVAECNIKTRRDFYHAEEVSTDMYTSIAAVIDKVEKQILKDKQRSVTRKRHNNNHKGAEVITTTSVVEIEEALGDRLPRIIRTYDVATKRMSVDVAAIKIGASDREYEMFTNRDSVWYNVVCKR